jgi:hypothetical protein
MLSPLHACPLERKREKEKEITYRREMAESVQLGSSGGVRCGDGGGVAEIDGDWSRMGASRGQEREIAGVFFGNAEASSRSVQSASPTMGLFGGGRPGKTQSGGFCVFGGEIR